MAQALLRWHQPVEQTTIIPFMILPQRTHAAGKSNHGCALTRSRFVGSDALLLDNPRRKT